MSPRKRFLLSSPSIPSFSIAANSWQSFSESAEVRTQDYRIGPLSIRVHYGDASLVRWLGRSIEFARKIITDAPTIEIFVWNARPEENLFPRVAQEQFINSNRSQTSLGNAIFIGRDKSVFFDSEERKAFICYRDTSTLESHEFSSPFRLVLQWAAVNQGSLMLHSAALSLGDQAALLCGQGGTGKSTTAMHLLGAGWKLLGEDYVCLSPGRKLAPVYRSAKVTETSLALFSEVEEFLRPVEFIPYPPRRKRIYFFDERFDHFFSREAKVDAIFLPQVKDVPDSKIEPASSADALRALAPSTLFQAPLSGENEFRLMSELVKQIPAFHLYLGREMKGIPSLMEKTLRALGSDHGR